MINKFFRLKEKNTSIKKEVIGGITTFLTMAYIIFLHPNMLAETGMDKQALITVTCLASFAGTLIVALLANVPFAMAPGLGLNSFFTYSIVLGMGIAWPVALGVVFVSGILFLLLTILGFREKLADAIPESLKLAVPAGIGLLIAFIGFQNMGLVIRGENTFLKLGMLTGTVLISLCGLLLIVFFEFRKIRGSILLGILFIVAVAMVLGNIQPPGIYLSAPPSIQPIAFQLDIGQALSLSLAGVIFSFLYVDLFDSIGTIIGCAYEADMIDKKGKIPKLKRILSADAIATLLGSLLGTSTVTTYVESASGIAAGARTGFASMITAFLFLLALFFAPVIGIVPAYATAPALVIVGFYMFKNIININFNSLKEGIPVFLTILLMPFTSSISTGLAFGFLSHVVLEILSGNYRKISPVLWLIALLSGANLVIDLFR
ncbi:MAG: NCS2 family permease [Cyclobacteriaceae bacterium]|nr:NCS2 family permease [Cyclobacteriaceae bacterium]